MMYTSLTSPPYKIQEHVVHVDMIERGRDMESVDFVLTTSA